eukprot:CAMPEP_0202875134 /NCGR_PEP_ID=MMETSP1391-20130828/26691_1 /ASSEMBLY_ACC=CAM_ASM_000867 /TAXON_ID=1034604 /ORGANISM="Chlamydomonas leiostraca, Strain SAG 11-49" /LENGTH=148 /DNA_ID=CAMNT_0049556747 /DNA_START=202 /DNA_END=645 /DNA_ORIENTATION=-
MTLISKRVLYSDRVNAAARVPSMLAAQVGRLAGAAGCAEAGAAANPADTSVDSTDEVVARCRTSRLDLGCVVLACHTWACGCWLSSLPKHVAPLPACSAWRMLDYHVPLVEMLAQELGFCGCSSGQGAWPVVHCMLHGDYAICGALNA